MKKSPLVSIIVVNWNGVLVLPDLFNSLNNLDYPNWELIFVDNGSEDESLQYLNKAGLEKSRLKVITNKKNLGFAPANNQGYKLAHGEYVLFLNNDTKFPPEFLGILVNKLDSESEVGVCQPKIYMMDQDKYLDNAGSFLNTIGFTDHWGFGQKDSKEFSSEREIFAAKGACMLVRQSVIEKVGLFDADFMSYFEESDFCWRVWLAGWTVKYYPDAFIWHKVGFSSKRLPQVDVNFHGLKNRICSFIKNFGSINLMTTLPIHAFLLTGLALFYLLRLQFGKSKMIVLAFIWNLQNLGSTIKKRSKVQKIRVKSDREIMPTIMHKTNFFELFSHFLKVEKNFK